MRPETIKLLETGFAAQQSGDLAQAERCYRKVLRDDAGNEFELNLMGVLLVRQENYRDAAGILESALIANAGDPETHNNLSLIHISEPTRLLRRSRMPSSA